MNLDFVRNFPLFCIILCLFSGPCSLILSGKRARIWNLALVATVLFLSLAVLFYVCINGVYVYQMGHLPAPWGNEIRVGPLEAFFAVFFCCIMLLCMVGGAYERKSEIEESKANLYYVMVDLLLSSLIALIYTNDLFTAYVFVEINTISACGMIMIKQSGHTLEAATRYMIMSLLGSGLLLLGICFLYGLTGHLLMSNIKEAVADIVAAGDYHAALMVAVGLMCVGLAIKSALFPFHSWLPDAYGSSSISSAAILSALVSKGYIFLLIKIIYRVIGFDVICGSKIMDIFFVFGIAGMVFGSISASREDNIRRMIAFSSVAQIGYIYMGFGLGTTMGMRASLYQILSHAATKSLLFIAAAGLGECSGGSKKLRDLTGAGYRNPIAGVAFTVGALSMIGFPLFSGFISKILFAQAAVNEPGRMLPTLLALAVSTILNVIYFMRAVILIYTPEPALGMAGTKVPLWRHPEKVMVYCCFIGLNLLLGLASQPVAELCAQGLELFS
jgi:multicomponent Na+:H+ antiporter subunit D